MGLKFIMNNQKMPKNTGFRYIIYFKTIIYIKLVSQFVSVSVFEGLYFGRKGRFFFFGYIFFSFVYPFVLNY